MSVGQQINNKNNTPVRVGTFNNNIDHRGKETCALFISPIYNKNSTINSFLPFFFLPLHLI